MLSFSEEEARGSESCSESPGSQGKRLRRELTVPALGSGTSLGHQDDLWVASASSSQPKVIFTEERAETTPICHPSPTPLSLFLK